MITHNILIPMNMFCSLCGQLACNLCTVKRLLEPRFNLVYQQFSLDTLAVYQLAESTIGIKNVDC